MVLPSDEESELGASTRSVLPAFEELPLSDQINVTDMFAVGDLSWMLEPHQVRIYNTVWELIKRAAKFSAATDVRIASIQACRKMGKSFINAMIAWEYAKQHPRSKILIVAPTADEAHSVFGPIFDEIGGFAPPSERPKVNSASMIYKFPNGSVIRIKGADLHPHRLRGPSQDLIIVDEAAFVLNLRRTVDSILRPMTMRTRGVLVMNSTRGLVPTCDFNLMHAEAEARRSGVTISVYDAGFTAEEIEAVRASTLPEVFQIEFECKDAILPSLMVIPEWTVSAEPGRLVDSIPVPAFGALPADPFNHIGTITWHASNLKRLTALDFGVGDNTIITCGIYDPVSDGVLVTREKVLHGAEATAGSIARWMRMLEAEDDRIVGATSERIRVGDHDMVALNTLVQDYALPILPVYKPSLEDNIGYVRRCLLDDLLRLHAPELANLIACLRAATWQEYTKNGEIRRRLARSNGVDRNGVPLRHFDALMGLVYLLAAQKQYCPPGIRGPRFTGDKGNADGLIVGHNHVIATSAPLPNNMSGGRKWPSSRM